MATYSVQGATVAKQLALRTVLRSRGTYGGVESPNPSATGTYPWVFLRDFVMMVRAFPGYWNATRLRATLDQFGAAIGGDALTPTAPGEHIATNGAVYYRPGHTYGYYPCFDNASYWTRLLCETHRAGDATAYSTWKAAAKAALDGTPRASDLLYSDPALTGSNIPTIGWGFEDYQYVHGHLCMVSALYVDAYLDLASVAASVGDSAMATSCTDAANLILTRLPDFRRVDNYYNASTNSQVPHAMATAFIVAKGYCSTVDRAASAAALLADYQAGKLTQRGALRHMPTPYTFPGAGSSAGTYQNGAYWLGEWITWLADSLAYAGRSDLALQVMQDATDELLRQHRVDGWTPWEWQNGASRGATGSGAASGFVADLTEASPRFVDLTLPTNDALELPHGHRITALAATASGPTTAVLVVETSPYVNAQNESIPSPQSASGVYSPIGYIYLTDSAAAETGVGVYPAWAYGSRVRVRLLSGANPGVIVVRLWSSPPAGIALQVGENQPVPPGYVLEWGGITGAATGDAFTPTGTVALLDAEANVVATGVGAVGLRYDTAATDYSMGLVCPPASITVNGASGAASVAVTVGVQDAAASIVVAADPAGADRQIIVDVDGATITLLGYPGQVSIAEGTVPFPVRVYVDGSWASTPLRTWNSQTWV